MKPMGLKRLVSNNAALAACRAAKRARVHTVHSMQLARKAAVATGFNSNDDEHD